MLPRLKLADPGSAVSANGGYSGLLPKLSKSEASINVRCDDTLALRQCFRQWGQEDLCCQGQHLSDWRGVKCVRGGRAVKLILVQCELSGSIGQSIGDLTHLCVLRLERNRLRGCIPRALGKCVSLYLLHLGDNKLSGEIPTELGALILLRVLDLRDNFFTGAIPGSLGLIPRLQMLRLDGNDLGGEMPLSIGLLKHRGCQVLLPGHRGFTLSAEMSNLHAQATEIGQIQINLDFSSFFLSGAISSALAELKLGGLNLGRNSFAGAVPELLMIPTLKWLDIGSNSFTSLPVSVSKMTNLSALDIGHNCFTVLPRSLSECTKLKLIVAVGNSIEDPPMGVIAQGVNGLRRHYYELDQEELINSGTIKLPHKKITLQSMAQTLARRKPMRAIASASQDESTRVEPPQARRSRVRSCEF